MSKPNRVVHAAAIEMLAEWEGPAIPAAGVLMDEKQVEKLSEEPDVDGIAAWIAVTAITEATGHEARKKKVRGVLTTCRQRFGQPKIDEIKQALIRHMQQYCSHRKITDEELRARIERLFDAL